MTRIYKTLYVGCSLTGAAQEFRSDVERLKKILRDKFDWEVYDFVGLTNGTDEDVYNWDISHCVGTCDVFLAILDHPSTGLGWELATAVKRGIPVLGVAHKDSNLARLVTGASKAIPQFSIERYKNLIDDVPELLRIKLLVNK